MELNVFNEPLISCCNNPKTGFYRDGFCRTDAHDVGTHTVCAVVTNEFLQYSARKGNDLITPIPHWNFPGLKDGDKWCLCVSRWLQAEKAGVAPPIVLKATYIKTLQFTTIELLKKYEYVNEN